MIFFQMFQQRRQFFQLRALARIDQQGRARKVSFSRRMQFRKNRDELHGKIIHAVKAHVLEGMQYGAFPVPGKAPYCMPSRTWAFTAWIIFPWSSSLFLRNCMRREKETLRARPCWSMHGRARNWKSCRRC